MTTAPTLSDVELEALATLAEEAVPNWLSWTAEDHKDWASPQTYVEADHPVNGRLSIVRFVKGEPSFWCTIGKAEYEWANARYIAAANPLTIKALLATIAQLKAEKDHIFKELCDSACQEKIAKESRKFWLDAATEANAARESAEAQLASVVGALEECDITASDTSFFPAWQRLQSTVASLPTTASNLLDRVKRAEDQEAAYKAVMSEATYASVMKRAVDAEAANVTLAVNARTPGTVEVCERLGQSHCEYEAPECCQLKSCPMRAIKRASSEGVKLPPLKGVAEARMLPAKPGEMGD